MGIRIPPRLDQARKLIFGKPHIESAHGFEGSDAPAVAKREFCYLPFLAEVTIDTVLHHRDAEHV